MKNVLKFLAAAMVVMLFSSCSQQAIYSDASGNSVSPSDSMSAKAKYSEPVVAEAPPMMVAKKYKKQGCTKCTSRYCPKPDCCDTVSKNVISRATMQGGSGEPHIGLIPTMKVLAP
jgi:hypothetical protein